VSNPNRPKDDPKPLPAKALRRKFDNRGCPIIEIAKGTWESPMTMAQVIERALGHPLTGGPLKVVGDAFPVGG
jgi:hypothetical protein